MALGALGKVNPEKPPEAALLILQMGSVLSSLHEATN
jgi:hypothetical protein